VDVRAIILVGADAETASSPPSSSQGSPLPEQLVGVPIAALDVVGQPVVCHVIDRLRNCGVREISVLSAVAPESGASLRDRLPTGVRHAETSAAAIWSLAEDMFLRMAKDGADAVILLRVGAYAEVDFNQLLKFHFARGNCATLVADQFRKPWDVLALDTGRGEEAAAVLRRRMQWHWRASETFVSYGYFNPLLNGRDFRKLAEDALMRRCALIPRAREVTPGVWLGERARLHNTTRVEGPAFIGERAKLREGVVVRACSSIEAYSEVDKRTLVDGSTVLPHTYIGKQLNLEHSVAGFSQIAQVDRNISVHISDERLTKAISPPSLKRTLQPVRSGLFLVKRSVAANLARMYSGREPMSMVQVEKQPSVKTARAHAAAASTSRNIQETKKDSK
jgi:NDP-sugar pyrophosphorylase family protein